jgi:hypothetical protein
MFVASRASQAPTGDLWWLQDLRTTKITLWEPASLLAMASGQSTWMLKLMASSPAG